LREKSGAYEFVLPIFGRWLADVVFSETLVRERLRSAHAIIRSMIPVPITRRKNERRTDIAITYVDGEGKSGAGYTSLYAEENGIAVNNIIPPSEFKAKFAK
jgi:hypothetical protein